jgi:RHS repeat-associated protein
VTVSAYSGVLPVTTRAARADEYRPTPVRTLPVTPRPERTAESRQDDPAWTSPAAAFPAPGTAEVDVPASGTARAGTLPVLVGAAATGAPRRVRIQVLDHRQSEALGAHVAVRVTRADGGRSRADVAVALEYGAFEHAYGGDFATRLHLAEIPACAAAPSCEPVPVATRIDGEAKSLHGVVAAAPDPAATTYGTAELGSPAVPMDYSPEAYPTTGAVSANAGQVSDYSATPFQTSQKWQVGIGSGGFSYSYDVPMPPAVAGPVPRMAFDYSSQAVDSRTAAENAQPSQVGEGWSFEQGYVERRFKPCSEDGWPGKGDSCWSALPEHYLHLNGVTSELVRPASGGNEWRLRDDPAWRVQHFSLSTAEPNGDVNRTYWVVTTPDGTRYQFGTGREPTTGTPTNSAWTVPVFGNNAGEACYNTTPSLAYCDAAWRFNLDYVKDVNGNAVTLFWTKETNRYQRYGAGAAGSASAEYVRGGYLSRVEYSQRAGSENLTAPSLVITGIENRCTVADCKPLSDPTVDPKQYPDVPGDLLCWSTTSCSKSAPSFFSGKRISQVATWVWNGSNYRPVTKVNLAHRFPATNENGVSPALWLDSITRVGALTTPEQPDPVTLPQVTLYGSRLVNRVDNDPANGVPLTYKFRIVAIRSETGGEIEVTYGQPNPCSPIPVGAWDINTKDCFPQAFTPTGGSPGVGAFNKYVVTRTRQVDDTGASGPGYAMVTDYTYLGTPAWHYDDSLVGGASQMWSQYRGYQRVQTQVPGPGGLLSTTQHLLYRGMHGDKLAGGGSKSVWTPADTEGGSFPDSDWLAGRTIEVSGYSTGGSHLTSEVYRYWAKNTVLGSTGFQQHNAQYVRQNVALSKYADTSTTADDWVKRRVDTTYDDTYAYATETYDWGGLAGPGDETCERYSTTPNPTVWLLSVRWRTLAYDGTCGDAAPPLISRRDVYYDNQAIATMPVKALVTDVGESFNATTRAFTKYAYDALGRVTAVTAPNQYSAATPKKTTTSYSPTTGYPYNGITVTDPLGHVTKTFTSSAWGGVVSTTDPNNKTTYVDRDPLGRVVAVRRPYDGGSAAPSVTYAYGVHYNVPSWVRRSELQSNDGAARYVDEYTIVDGFGRTVQTQTRSPYVAPGDTAPAGRVLVSTRYDVQGNVDARTQPLYDPAGAGTSFVLTDPSWTDEERYDYDPLGRQTEAQQWRQGTLQWRTSTTHYGTHVKIDHPVRGDVRRYTDVFGRLTKVSESLASGTADTTYTYTAKGELDTITDDLGNVWNYDYDMLGRRTQSKDPDQGTWQTAYHPGGNVKTVTDAKSATVEFTYDEGDRKTAVYAGSATGTKLAQWTYDTAPLGVGRPASATRYDGGAAYTTAVTGYDDRGRVTGKTVSVPPVEGPLAGTYAYTYGYNLRDVATSVTFPAAGDLPAETVTTTNDVTGRPKTLSGASSYVTATDYTAEGRLLHRAVGPTGAVERSFQYDDPANRLSDVLTTNSGAIVEKTAYVYDAESNVKAIVNQAVAGQWQVECFGYDARNQLVRAFTNTSDETTCGTPAPTWPDMYDLTYTIDTIGNITSVLDAGTTKTYTHPPSGATSVRPHAVSSAGATTYGYDANGAMTTRGADTLAWDELHQLESVSGATPSTFTYDADGSRLLRRVGSSSVTRTLYLDGMELSATGSGPVTATRYYGSYAMRTAAGVTVLLRNHQGSTSVSLDPTGTVSVRKYLPYGGQRGSIDLATERGFLDKTEDPTGLVAVGARYYDPGVGRFISVDPVITPVTPQSFNSYEYSLNNPSTLVDPSGLVAISPDATGGLPDCGWNISCDGPPTKPAKPSPSPQAAPQVPSVRGTVTDVGLAPDPEAAPAPSLVCVAPTPGGAARCTAPSASTSDVDGLVRLYVWATEEGCRIITITCVALKPLLRSGTVKRTVCAPTYGPCVSILQSNIGGHDPRVGASFGCCAVFGGGSLIWSHGPAKSGGGLSLGGCYIGCLEVSEFSETSDLNSPDAEFGLGVGIGTTGGSYGPFTQKAVPLEEFLRSIQ